MPSVLICGGENVVRELAESPIWRDGLDRQTAGNVDQAVTVAAASRPSLVVVDRDLPRAESLVQRLRSNATTHKTSILIVARGDMQSEELGLLSAGANAVLRLPPSPEWEATVARLLSVPTRKQARLPVHLAIEATFGTEKVRGNILNVSLTGMLVECTDPLPVGTDLAFDFHLPGFEISTGDIRGNARVVRLAGAGRFGCEFLEIRDYGAEMLRRFLLVP